MPIFKLSVKATLHNIRSFSVDSTYAWHIVFLCTNCGEHTEHPLVFHESDHVEQVKSESNLVYKCKFCDRENGVRIVPGKHEYINPSRDDEDEEEEDGEDRQKEKKKQRMRGDGELEEYQVFAEFEARGMSPVSWSIVNGFLITSVSGFTFEDDEGMQDKEFYAYDEKLKQDVSISELEYAFSKR